MYIVLMFTVPLLLIFSREIASATLLYVLGNGRISGCCRCLQLWWPHQRLLPLQLWWPRQRLLLPGESLLSRARVPQTAGKSSVRVCLPMRTLLLQTVYTHSISNDICMLVCMFELGFKVGSAPLMEPQAAFYIYKLAMGFLSQHALRAVCNVCTHYKQLMSINIYRGG